MANSQLTIAKRIIKQAGDLGLPEASDA